MWRIHKLFSNPVKINNPMNMELDLLILAQDTFLDISQKNKIDCQHKFKRYALCQP